MFIRDGLTPLERDLLHVQVRQARCAVCLHRDAKLRDGDWTCEKGLEWPRRQRSICEGFELDETV